jgi:hypothetical protein
MLLPTTITSPNIGCLGITADFTNNRVKGLFDDMFFSAKEIEKYLFSHIHYNNEAMILLQQPNARFTARFITPKGLVGATRIVLPGGIEVSEEARITTNQFDIIYLGGNGPERFDSVEYSQEWKLAMKCMQPHHQSKTEVNASFHRLNSSISAQDIKELLDIYHSCFRSYLVPLDDDFIKTAAETSIFWVARNSEGTIVASAIGESLKLEPITLFEISEVAAHPDLRIRSAASGCVKRVVEEGKKTLPGHVVAFMEARMWQNILGMSQTVGLSCFAGILHQHCCISSQERYTSIPQTPYGSLAVCYSSN